MTHAPLTPAEAYVLLDPGGSSSIEAFEITFLLLVAMEVLEVSTLETRSLFSKRGAKPVVSVIKDPPAIFLAAEVVDVVRMARGPEHGRDFLALAHSAYKRVLLGPLDIVTMRIGPALAARGWLESTEQAKDSAGGRPATHWRHTPAGLAEKQRIQSLLDRARQLPALIETDPAQARAIVLATGWLLLLVPELRPIYGKLTALEGGHAGSLQFGRLDARLLDQGFGVFEAYFDGSRYT